MKQTRSPRRAPLFARTCRDVTRLVLQGEDRHLGFLERTAVRFHMRICDACPRFVRQLSLMRSAMGRWSAYADATNEKPL